MCATVFGKVTAIEQGKMKLCCAQQHHIISWATRGKSQGETYRLLQEVYGDDSLSKSTCRRWYMQALQGNTSSADLEQPGHEMTVCNLANVRAVQQVLETDRCATVRQIAAEVQLSTGSVHNILCKDLDVKKKAPKFVPWILTQEQKELHVHLCQENLQETQDPLFLWSLVTGDESWFSVLEPEQKQQSLQWVSKEAKRPKKALHSHQACKMMMEGFFDNQGVTHLDSCHQKLLSHQRFTLGFLEDCVKQSGGRDLQSGVTILIGCCTTMRQVTWQCPPLPRWWKHR